ncbi:MAG: GNAT family N-acetyltransferase [bacterium]|nr:GNAT family N-acetyltransferase [bacterium]
MRYRSMPKYRIDHQCSLQDAVQVAHLIQEENRKSPHMLEKTPEKILTDAQTYGAVVAKIKEQLIGFIGLMEVKDEDTGLVLYERGSLIVHPQYRGYQIGRKLRDTLLRENREKPIYTITNVPKVIDDNRAIGEYLLLQDEIPLKVKKIVESAGALLPDDIMFVNKTLYDLLKTL